MLFPTRYVFTACVAPGNGETSRCEWQSRTESQGFDSKAASLVFDSIDNDHDGAISNAEYIADLLAADTIVRE